MPPTVPLTGATGNSARQASHSYDADNRLTLIDHPDGTDTTPACNGEGLCTPGGTPTGAPILAHYSNPTVMW